MTVYTVQYRGVQYTVYTLLYSIQYSGVQVPAYNVLYSGVQAVQDFSPDYPCQVGRQAQSQKQSQSKKQSK